MTNKGWKKFMLRRMLLAVLIVGVTVVAVRTADSAETIARAVATELSARDFDRVTERFNGQMAAALSKNGWQPHGIRLPSESARSKV